MDDVPVPCSRRFHVSGNDITVARRLHAVLDSSASTGAGPCDLAHELRASGSTVAVAAPKPPSAPAAAPAPPSTSQPSRPTVPQDLLSDFAKRHNVDVGDMMGSHKRPSPAESPAEASVAKRTCTPVAEEPTVRNRPSAERMPAPPPPAMRPPDAGKNAPATDVVARGMTAARQFGVPAPVAKSKLGLLAERLGPYLGGATQLQSQAGTQMLQLGQGDDRLQVLGPQPLFDVGRPAAAAGGGRKPAGSRRVRAAPRPPT